MYDRLYPWLKTTTFYKTYRRSYARAANAFYGKPSAGMFVIGVTGTNGKTTTVNILHHLLQKHVGPTLAISSAFFKFSDEAEVNDRKMWSLDPFVFQKMLVRAREKWCQVAVIEVTSIGIDQFRFEGIDFDMAILTNITNDHLDYHGGFQEYMRKKKSLFKGVLSNGKWTSYAVFPKDDSIGRRRDEEMSMDSQMTFGVASNAVLAAKNIVERVDGTSATVNYLGEEFPLETQLVGRFNVANILAAVSAVVLMGVEVGTILPTVKDIVPILGRMDKFSHDGVHYFVDYAHTEDALEKTLQYLKDIKWEGRLIAVSWCMGDGRDKHKRPAMGRILDINADVVILADEDPAEESRLEIIWDMVHGMKRKEWDSLFILPERKFALQFVADIVKPWDTVFLAGKWHETVMLTKYGRRKWNDAHEMKTILWIVDTDKTLDFDHESKGAGDR